MSRVEHRSMVTKPLIVTDNLGKFNVVVTTVGGGTAGQAGAISMGIARALLKANAENRAKLKKNGLTRY